MRDTTTGDRDGAVAPGRAPDLIPVSAEDIPERHPVRLLDAAYRELLAGCEGQHLPDFGTFLKRVDRELLDYCLVLSPVVGNPFIDFIVLRKGQRIPGADLADFEVGASYAQHIMPGRVSERLMELASCLALRQARLSSAQSARKSTLHVRVFRAVCPVWDQSLQRHVVLLAVAPVYATVAHGVSTAG